MADEHLMSGAVRDRVRRSTMASGVPERVEDRAAAEQVARIVAPSSSALETPTADRRAS